MASDTIACVLGYFRHVMTKLREHAKPHCLPENEDSSITVLATSKPQSSGPSSTPAPSGKSIDPTRTIEPKSFYSKAIALDPPQQSLSSSDSRNIKRAAEEISPSRVDPYNPFFIPASILFDTPVLPQTNSPLLQLPPELLLQIVQHVRIPYFQVCLSLTCKALGRIANSRTAGGTQHAISPWRGWRDKEGLFRLFERSNKSSSGSQPWMPRTLRLCRACFVFVPSSPQYWEAKMASSAAFDRREVNWNDILAFLDTENHGQRPCPNCTVNGFISYYSEGQYLRDRRCGGEFLVASGVPRPCPDLNRRMDQP